MPFFSQYASSQFNGNPGESVSVIRKHSPGISVTCSSLRRSAHSSYPHLGVQSLPLPSGLPS